MKIIRGVGASGGVVIAPIVQAHGPYTGLNRRVYAPLQEKQQIAAAVEKAGTQLQTLRGQAADKQDADIFLFQQAMLEDKSFLREITEYIEAGAGAAAAVERAANLYIRRMRGLEDEYFSARAGDIQDAARRLVHILDGEPPQEKLVLTQPSILAAEEIYPSDLLGVNRELLLGFVSESSSTHAHAAIMARTLGIPAVVMAGAHLASQCAGQQAVLDGDTGCVYLQPTPGIVQKYRKKISSDKAQATALRRLVGKPAVTKDGVRIQINANAGQPDDIDAAVQNDAEEIGLYRSELAYMEHSALPTEQELYEVYAEVVRRAQGRTVTIRTLDLGADKCAPCLRMPKEDNPSLGYRAIRICLHEPEIFRAQLRALLRAATLKDARMRILLPMITDVAEVREAVRCIAEARASLRGEGVTAPWIPLGLMIETPAAVLTSDLLAAEKEVAFFSIGTNDLTQYTLAADRANGLVGDMFNPRCTAVLRMIRTVTENAHAHGVRVSVCGESAADEQLTAFYLAVGVDALSVPPNSVLPLRKAVRGITVQEAQAEADALLRGEKVLQKGEVNA